MYGNVAMCGLHIFHWDLLELLSLKIKLIGNINILYEKQILNLFLLKHLLSFEFFPSQYHMQNINKQINVDEDEDP